jgi:acyl-CoA dehydrogenase
MGTDETRAMLADATARIFSDLADPQALAHRADDGWRKPLWRALEDAGLTRAWVPEALGGAGAGLGDGFEILSVAGGHAVAVPLAETLLAGWLLAQAGQPVPAGILSVAPAHPDDRISLSGRNVLRGLARALPFARDAARLVVLVSDHDRLRVALVDPARCQIERRENLAREPRDDVVFKGVKPEACTLLPDDFAEESLMAMGAVARAAQMSGALEAVLERSVAYANERVAFERPIAKFQAVQHALARLAGETAAALAAARSAADALESAARFDEGALLESAAAKIRVAEAASSGAAIAHQVHGAIGYSSEHALHRYTQRLLAWRDDFGDESAWALRLGCLVAARGADALWPLLAAR